jgi:hypothetical protein
MFALDSGIVPAKIVRAAAAPFLITTLVIFQAGCASDSNVYYAKTPVVAAYVAKAPAAEVEADGLPTQPPPSPRIRQMPDDPSEPTVAQIRRRPMRPRWTVKIPFAWRRPPFLLTCQPVFADSSWPPSIARTRLVRRDTVRGP